MHAPYHASVEAARQMPEGGRMLIIDSVNGDRMPVCRHGCLCREQSALQGMSRGLARDFGPRGITINVVQPGPLIPTLIPPTGQCAICCIVLWLSKAWATGRGRWYGRMVSRARASFVTGAMHTIDGAFGA
ncbi:SDR family oxidoreductase [Shigella flexneri]